MKTTFLYAQLEVHDAAAEIWLNDVPLLRIDDRTLRAPIENVALDAWVIPGENVFELVFEPGPTPSVARSQTRRELLPKTAGALARIIQFEVGSSGEAADGLVLAALSYPPPDTAMPEVEVQLPIIARTSVNLGPGSGRFRFQDAPLLADVNALRPEIDAVLEAMESAYRSGDVDALAALYEINQLEVMRAFPAFDQAVMRSRLAANVGHYAKGSDPVRRDPALRDERLVAYGRLVECVDRDFEASFKLNDPDGRGTASAPTFLGRDEHGRLRVFR